MAVYTEAMKNKYAMEWKSMVISPGKISAVYAIAKKLIKNKTRYQTVSLKTGVPWFVIAVLHERESDADFTTHLHNGDSLRARTHHVPAGRPPTGSPPFTWEFSAIDALTYEGLNKISDWSIEHIAFVCEGYNGWGYYSRGVPSAYLWSFSNIYKGGKYVADGVWSSSAMDSQCGVMPILAAMAATDQNIKLDGKPAPVPPSPDAPVVAKVPEREDSDPKPVVVAKNLPNGNMLVPQPQPWWQTLFNLLTKWRM